VSADRIRGCDSRPSFRAAGAPFMDEKCGARDQESRYDSGSRTRDYLVKALELPIQQFRRWHEFLIGVSSLAVKSLSFAFPGDLLWFTIVGLRKFFRRSLHVQMLRIILAPRRKDAKFGNQFSFAPLRLCGRHSDLWLRLCRAVLFVVKSLLLFWSSFPALRTRSAGRRGETLLPRPASRIRRS